MVMHHERVDSWSTAKKHEQELHMVYEPFHTRHSCKQVAKRSFRLACNRAKQHGFTWYRDGLVSASHLGVLYEPHQSSMKLPPNVPGHKHKLRQRLTCFSWNAGGLSTDGWDAFQLWMEKQQIDILAIQETHWPFSTEWVLNHYWALHSGTGHCSGGVMCLISKKLCPEHLISWHEPIPGRLLHLRIHGLSKCIDVINISERVQSVSW